MNLIINGETVSVPGDCTRVVTLLEHFGFHTKVVIVEHNGNILEKRLHESTPLVEGDRVEMIHFVGGG
ncbi:sulfur carrier protein ThiS [Paenibacillus gansuensis]|uniref:Sulfur carrier protein ThiS n=1 Tax=Paenibacillus gansuensis TaxID=306542 RepID=A0ABW5P7H8_9BACL